jgi:hypothetical protein
LTIFITYKRKCYRGCFLKIFGTKQGPKAAEVPIQKKKSSRTAYPKKKKSSASAKSSNHDHDSVNPAE